MLKLKVKQKLLAIWLGSIVFALVLMAGLFQYQMAELHQQDARASIAAAIEVLHKELESVTIRIRSSVNTLSIRGDIVSSVSMIDRYQDPANYQGAVFDGEKQQLAMELAQHASATNADIIAIYDSKEHLAAFYLSPAALGLGAGYVVFENGAPKVVTLDPALAPAQRDIPSLIFEILPHSKRAGVVSYTKDGHMALSAQAPIVRKSVSGTESTVGWMLAGRILDANFQASVQRLVGMEMRIVPPGGHIDPPLPGIDDSLLENGVARLVLDTVISHPEGLEHTWRSTDEHFIGAVKLIGHEGRDVGFIFAQRKDTLESTLATFQQSVGLVLLLSGLVVLPIGVYFLNRTITRPVENLMLYTDKLRKGQAHDMATLSSTDEFGTLARAFQDMATAVNARETALRESQAGLKNAQRIARLGSWMWNIETGRITCSDEIYAILERTPAQLGDNFDAFMACVHDDDGRTLRRRIAESMETGEPFSVEHRICLPNGQERFVVNSGEIRLSDGDGDSATHITATLQDITERHLLEQAKSELISTVSHELRTPLTSIIGTLGLAVGGVMGELPDRLRGMLAAANKNAKRLSALIDDLLDIEKITNGSMNFDFRPLNVASLLRKAQTVNQAYAQNLGVAIRVSGEIPDAKIYGDADRFAQVMANLLSNACKFTPEGGQVKIRAERIAATIAISISDPGPGIPEEFEAQMFERFAQADQSLTRKDQRGGTGLGLAITKAIVDMHNGRIAFTTVRPPAPDHGTTFTVILPEWREEGDETPLKL